MSLASLPGTTIDSGGYPTDAFLAWLKAEQNANTALQAATKYFVECGFGAFFIKNGLLHLATGGWSGCEDVINALSENLVVWRRWEEHHKGGRWTFRADGIEV